ncbi:hypothetical protein VNO77_13271 [Canavalia gladiata]|uniref:Pre-mRNA-splicing factor SLU7 n=1 Tax=Canavalia gladiata TaxID=3824 RepID=A0AAN9M2H6_CANGL
MKKAITEKYGNVAAQEELPKELLLGQTERQVEYDHTPTLAEEKRLATWGTDVPDDLVLDQKKLAEALKKKREEKDERKRKYNVRWNDEITPEEVEAYRMKKIHHDDPMKDFLRQVSFPLGWLLRARKML